jgi:hypothetical protein
MRERAYVSESLNNTSDMLGDGVPLGVRVGVLLRVAGGALLCVGVGVLLRDGVGDRVLLRVDIQL